MEPLDLVIVGAGWYGLVVAKTYLEINPTHNILIVDANASIGGTWAEERLYPELLSNNMLGTFEWSDFPMDTETYGVKPGEHIPGKVIYKYLSDYVTRFNLIDRIQFNSRVEAAENTPDDTWLLTITHTKHVERSGPKAEELSPLSSSSSKSTKISKLATKKLVIATGRTSDPNLPHFKGEESFEGPIFHFVDFPKYRDQTIINTNSNGQVRRAAILGGAKSAWDAAYAYATAGIPVEMIIRKSGTGPGWMSPPYVTPFRLWLEKVIFTRCLTWFSPCVWGDADGYGFIRSFLHGSSVGRWIVDKFWWVLGNDLLTLNAYDKHPKTKKLTPWFGPFWCGSMLSILNYPTNFYDLVKNDMIRVHIADIEELSKGTIHLSNGEELNVDFLCCATGWKHSVDVHFLPEGSDAKLGLPHYSSDPDLEELDTKIDDEIFRRFPRLKSQPTVARETVPQYITTTNDGSSEEIYNQPLNLYRFMIPPAHFSKRNVGFVGVLTPLNVPMVAQTQALWLTAYFNGRIDFKPSSPWNTRPSPHPGGPNSTIDDPTSDTHDIDIQWDAKLMNRFGRWRCPGGFGARFPDFVFDTVPYIDLLLSDLKLKSHRKKGAFAPLAELFLPYGPEDYRGLTEEWKAAYDGDTAPYIDISGTLPGSLGSPSLRKRLN